MTFPISRFFYLFILISICFSCKTKDSGSPDPQLFKEPATISGVHSWWHWLDGRITRDGITRDLEAMKEQGIVQATILNVGLFESFGLPTLDSLSVKETKFDSEEWYDLFRWALEEADRLGIRIGVHNCDGWSSSGGPWITPEMSMKQFVFTKTRIQGGKRIQQILEQPLTNHSYYKDVAVMAVKSSVAPSAFQIAQAELLKNGQEKIFVLKDGNPSSFISLKEGDQITISFQEPFKASRIHLFPFQRFSWGDLSVTQGTFMLESSDDGKHFEKISEFQIQGVNQAFSTDYPQTLARYYRLSLTHLLTAENYNPYGIGEIELLNPKEQGLYEPLIPYNLVKTSSVKGSRDNETDVCAKGIPEENNPLGEGLDLTSKMAADGTLEWDAPEGNWTLIRFGYTSTGAMNAPATAAGRGLECDKMDSAAVGLHFRSFPQKLVDAAGSYSGNVFRFILIDSWECGFQNWTNRLPDEFSHRRGYDLSKWIPALCGEIVENTENTEAFLYDFRTTLGELIERNYYQYFSELCHSRKLEMHAEVIYGGAGYPPMDVIRANQYADLPMWEFWAGHNPATSFPENTSTGQIFPDFPAASTVCNSSNIIGAEAYTAQAHYSESPWDLKSFGDRAYCSGINQFILHSYVHQPTDQKPGMTLYQWGSHFNRNNIYWPHLSGWFEYHARVQYLLQKGRMAARILAFTGDQLPQSTKFLYEMKLPFGYGATLCNREFLSTLRVDKGELISPNGLSYAMLVLPPQSGMEISSLKIIASLVKQGARVAGARPGRILSLDPTGEAKKDFLAYSDLLWGSQNNEKRTYHTYGKGMIFPNSELAEVLKTLEIIPDFASQAGDSLHLMYIHKRVDQTDLYFVANQTDQFLERNIQIRTHGNVVEVWDPENGSIAQIKDIVRQGELISIPVHFLPKQALFFICKQVNGGESSALPAISLQQKKEWTLVDKLEGKLILYNADGSILKSIPVSQLVSWTESTDDRIKYFSGIGEYILRFDVPENWLQSKDSLWLSLGEIGCTAMAELNGISLGTIWRQNAELPVTGILKKENTLRVKIANLYRNRIIGDYIQYGKIKSLWTSAPVHQYLDKSKPLRKSGLMGPVRISRMNNQSVTDK